MDCVAMVEATASGRDFPEDRLDRASGVRSISNLGETLRPTRRPSRVRKAPTPSFTRPKKSPASRPRLETIAMTIES